MKSGVQLIRAGDGFLLVGYDFPAANAQMPHIYQGTLSLDGVLSDLKDFAIDNSRLPRIMASGAYFAVTRDDKPADQLLTIFVDYLRAEDEYRLVAFTETIAHDGSNPVVIALLPGLRSATQVQVATGTAASGNVGLVAWGVPVAHGPINYVLLSAHAAMGTPGEFFVGEPGSNASDWDCLATFNGTGGLGFSVIQIGANGTSTWHIVELDEEGTAKHTKFDLPTTVAYCRIVGSPASGGRYALAFQSLEGIHMARYQPGGGSLQAALVMPKALSGLPEYDRRPVWAGPAGDDVSVGIYEVGGRPTSVARFDSDGVPQGDPLPFPTLGGVVEQISSWVEPNLVYATYVNSRVNSSSDRFYDRYFLKIIPGS
jgi:hypothetical protein